MDRGRRRESAQPIKPADYSIHRVRFLPEMMKSVPHNPAMSTKKSKSVSDVPRARSRRAAGGRRRAVGGNVAERRAKGDGYGSPRARETAAAGPPVGCGGGLGAPSLMLLLHTLPDAQGLLTAFLGREVRSAGPCRARRSRTSPCRRPIRRCRGVSSPSSGLRSCRSRSPATKTIRMNNSGIPRLHYGAALSLQCAPRALECWRCLT
jgi:hypothetical protein